MKIFYLYKSEIENIKGNSIFLLFYINFNDNMNNNKLSQVFYLIHVILYEQILNTLCSIGRINFIDNIIINNDYITKIKNLSELKNGIIYLCNFVNNDFMTIYDYSRILSPFTKYYKIIGDISNDKSDEMINDEKDLV